MDVNQLLNRFADAQKTMKQMGGMMGLPGMRRKATKSPKNKRKGTQGRPRRRRVGGGGLPGGGFPAWNAVQLSAGPRPRRRPGCRRGFTLPKLDFSKLTKRNDKIRLLAGPAAGDWRGQPSRLGWFVALWSVCRASGRGRLSRTVGGLV